MYQTYRLDIDPSTYVVIDTEFEHRSSNNTFSIWEVIVEAYEERNLPVVPNLIRAIQGFDRHTSAWSLSSYIINHIHGNVEKYKPELEKYLILL